jgi:hypothetical protein
MKRIRFLTFFLVLPLFLSACGAEESVKIPPDSGAATFRYNFPGGQVADERYGEEIWFAYGAVVSTGDNAANGLAKTHCFDSGTCVHTVQVNIAPASEGTFYECWLFSPTTGERVSTGHLTSTFGDARHNLEYQSAEDLRPFTGVLITLEKDDGDPKPGTLQAEGTLKEVKRDQ